MPKTETVNKNMVIRKRKEKSAQAMKSMIQKDLMKKINKHFYHPSKKQALAIKSVKGIKQAPMQTYEKAAQPALKRFINKNLSGYSFANKSMAHNIVRKALTTGYGDSPQTQPDGAATRVQDLDPNIKQLTYGENDFTLYPKLIANGIINASSTVVQYIVFERHGVIGHSLFQHEIGITHVSQPNMHQKTVYMKYLTATRQESYAAQIVQSVEDADRINELDALTTLGKTIEWACFYGDSDLTANANNQGVEFDGLLKLTDPRNFINANGHSLTPEMLNRAATDIARGFGTPTDAYMPVGVKADFSNEFLGAQRIMMPTHDGYTAGTNVDQFISVRGTIALHGSTVMDLDNILPNHQKVAPNAPAKPTITKLSMNTEATGNFNEDRRDNNIDRDKVVGEVGKTMNYKVVASSTAGDSYASDPKPIKINKDTDAPQLTIKLAGDNLASYVSIYRQGLVHKDYWLIARVPVHDMRPDSTIVFTDTNARLPETGDVFVGEIRPTTIALYQLLPMTRLNLAQVTDATSFSILWYGALAVFIPRRFAVIRNVRYNEFSSNDEEHLEGLTTTGYGPVVNNNGSQQA